MKATLFYFLTGQDQHAKRPPSGVIRTPETVSCIFLEKAHVVEYILVGPEKKRLVSLFLDRENLLSPATLNTVIWKR